MQTQHPRGQHCAPPPTHLATSNPVIPCHWAGSDKALVEEITDRCSLYESGAHWKGKQSGFLLKNDKYFSRQGNYGLPSAVQAI